MFLCPVALLKLGFNYLETTQVLWALKMWSAKCLESEAFALREIWNVKALKWRFHYSISDISITWQLSVVEEERSHYACWLDLHYKYLSILSFPSIFKLYANYQLFNQSNIPPYNSKGKNFGTSSSLQHHNTEYWLHRESPIIQNTDHIKYIMAKKL